MIFITWTCPRCVQELATILGPENPTQRSCELFVLLLATLLALTFNILLQWMEEDITNFVCPLQSSPSAQQCSNTMRSVGADSVITHVHCLYITTLHLTAVTVGD